jgi:hypothetical protein
VTNQLAIPSKRTRFGPKVASGDWWIERIKFTQPKYTNYWTHFTKYQIGQCKALAELDYQVLGERVSTERAPDSGLAREYPIKLTEKPFWLTWDYKTFKDFKQPRRWTYLSANRLRLGSITSLLRVIRSRPRSFWIPSGSKTRKSSTFFCKRNTT